MNCSILRILTLASAVLLAACSNKDENTAAEIPEPVAESTVSGHLYVGHDAGPVSVYSLMSFGKLDDIAVGESPKKQGTPSLDLSSDGNFLALAMNHANALAIVDTSTRQLVHKVPLGGLPSLVRTHGMTAVVAHANNQISVVDLPSGEIKRTFNVTIEPQNMVFASEGQHVVATHENHDELFVYNLDSGERLEQVDLSEYGVRPRGVAHSPKGKHLAVALEYSNKILILNDGYKVVGEMLTGEVPYEVAYNHDGSELVVALVRGKALQVFDTETLMLKREMPVDNPCFNFAFTPDHTHLIMACEPGNTLLVMNYATGTRVRNIQENAAPRGLAVSSH